MIASGAEPDAGQEPTQPIGLPLALVRQRAAVVGAVPGVRVAGMGVAEEVGAGSPARPSRPGQAPWAGTAAASRLAQLAGERDELVDPLAQLDEHAPEDGQALLLGPVASAGSS